MWIVKIARIARIVMIARIVKTASFALIVTIAGMSFWKTGSSEKSCLFSPSLSERKRGSFRGLAVY